MAKCAGFPAQPAIGSPKSVAGNEVRFVCERAVLMSAGTRRRPLAVPAPFAYFGRSLRLPTPLDSSSSEVSPRDRPQPATAQCNGAKSIPHDMSCDKVTPLFSPAETREVILSSVRQRNRPVAPRGGCGRGCGDGQLSGSGGFGVDMNARTCGLGANPVQFAASSTSQSRTSMPETKK